MNGHMYITGQLICEDRGKQPGGKKKRKKKRNVRVTQKHTQSWNICPSISAWAHRPSGQLRLKEHIELMHKYKCDHIQSI